MSTAIATPPAGATPAVPTPVVSVPGYFARLKRFTVAEYQALIRAGVIPERSGVVLIEGYLVHTMPQNPPHRTAVNRVRKRLDGILPAGWNSYIQGPVALGESRPEPDFVAVRGTDDDFAARDPGPADIGLVVEVADSSLDIDRTDSQRIYARAGLPVYWIVNIPDRQIEVYTDPQPAATPPAYATRTDYPAGAAVPVVLVGVAVGTVPVADVLP